MFVKTDTILDKILARKHELLMQSPENRPTEAELSDAAQRTMPARDFAGALHRETIALIAEVKKASPSKGVLIEDFDPVALAATYADNGAACISVLTDEDFFQGHLEHMRQVHQTVPVPVLRKDFIIDAVQVYEGRAAGADAMLLIAAALEEGRMAELHTLIRSLGMAALVEVHDEAELDRVLNMGARLVGVNNRDLKTFREDLGVTERLAKRLPGGVTLVAESAMRSLDDVRRMGDAGAHAVLIGEGLVKAGDIGAQVRAFSRVVRKV